MEIRVRKGKRNYKKLSALPFANIVGLNVVDEKSIFDIEFSRAYQNCTFGNYV